MKEYNRIYEDEGKGANQGELIDSLEFLTKLLHKIYSQPVYILIDEYDKTVNHLL
ncbi:MAG: AAA family ATPase, partial [Candidatus Midichloria sp.]|nr:AAA family ATPase [Candidatus Midichloria sp.]